MPKGNPDVFKRQAEEVRSIFGDLEIVEAKSDFIVYVTADEQENGRRGDARNCMFSNACKRAFGSKGVLFYPTVAYVDMIDPNDPTRRIVMRFVLAQKTREMLEAFDMGNLEHGKAREATFVLKAVPKTRTLEYMAKDARKRTRRRLLQEQTPAELEQTERKREQAKRGHETRRNKALMGVRDGGGRVRTAEA